MTYDSIPNLIHFCVNMLEYLVFEIWYIGDKILQFLRRFEDYRVPVIINIKTINCLQRNSSLSMSDLRFKSEWYSSCQSGIKCNNNSSHIYSTKNIKVQNGVVTSVLSYLHPLGRHNRRRPSRLVTSKRLVSLHDQKHIFQPTDKIPVDDNSSS